MSPVGGPARRPARHVRDERGAVALMAGLLGVVLFAVAAICVDLGISYVSKRQLQTAADAGALAAAQAYRGQTGQCATLSTDLALKQNAQQAADTLAEQNRPGKSGTPVVVTCPAGGGLKVEYSVSGSTGTSFTGIFDGPASITTSRRAGAVIGNTTNVGGLRPWGICSQVVNTTGQVVFVPMRHGTTTTQDSNPNPCGTDGPPGGWWVAQCNGQSNANGTTEQIVTTGCPQSHYTPVPNQLASYNPSQLYNYLTGYCPSRSANSTCLSSDQGNNFHNSSPNWQGLVGQTIQMPVFCVKTKCSQMAVAGSGNNASYAIHMIATVEICGFRFPPRAGSTGWPTTGPCATANPKNYVVSSITGGNNSGGIFLVIKGLAGGTTPAWSLAEYKSAKLVE